MSFSFKSIASWVFLALFGLAFFARCYRINSNDFVFYDEGMYLEYNKAFLQLVQDHFPKNLQEFWIIFSLIFKTALATPKALWFFLINLRVFIVGVDGLYFSRYLSAGCGIATVIGVFYFAKRYFNSLTVAVLSALILSLLPSHLFYSRQGMQEAMSTLLFLGSIYWYVFSKRGLTWGVSLSALLMFAVFLTNYRMIVGPVFILLITAYSCVSERVKPDLIKIGSFMLIYLLGFLLLGLLEGGINLKVNAAWMLNQAGESRQYRQWYNFLSFPYYFFKLENIFFGALFFSGAYFILKRKIKGLLPFSIVVLQMFLFSFAAEKGARYLCVVFPFAVMGVAFTVNYLHRSRPKIAYGMLVLMILGFCYSDVKIISASTGYQRAVNHLKANDPNAKILATQPVVEKLFISNEADIEALPKTIGETAFLVSKGYRYLIIDPQLYISWTADGQRFSLKELDFIAQLRQQGRLIEQIPHMDNALLERFVLDHNQDLRASLNFLSNAGNHADIFIYDLGV